MKKKVCNLELDSRRNRHFSEEFKRQVVDKLILKSFTVLQASRQYQVSTSTIYRWLYQYSPYHEKGVRIVVEMESEAAKNRQLQEKIAHFERVIGRKQLEIDFLNKLIEVASEELGVDIKKNYSTSPSSGSVNTDLNTPSP